MPSTTALDHIALALSRITDAVPFPVGDDGFVHRFLAGRAPGIHHVTFKVPRRGG